MKCFSIRVVSGILSFLLVSTFTPNLHAQYTYRGISICVYPKSYSKWGVALAEEEASKQLTSWFNSKCAWFGNYWETVSPVKTYWSWLEPGARCVKADVDCFNVQN
jgi:hypothetical protein